MERTYTLHIKKWAYLRLVHSVRDITCKDKGEIEGILRKDPKYVKHSAKIVRVQ